MIDGLFARIHNAKTISISDGAGLKSQERGFVEFGSVKRAPVVALWAKSADHYDEVVRCSNIQLLGEAELNQGEKGRVTFVEKDDRGGKQQWCTSPKKLRARRGGVEFRGHYSSAGC